MPSATRTRKTPASPRRSGDVNRPAPRAPKPATGGIVIATHKGFYEGNRIRVGQEFTLTDPKNFNPKWMKRKGAAGASKPASETPTGSSSSSTGDAGVL